VNELEKIISKLSNMMTQVEESAKEQFGLSELTLTQMNYLETINQLENPNITELATSLKLTKPTVTVAIDKLIEREYVYKVQSDEDRRSSHLHLTEKGKKINQMHDFAHKQIAESVSKRLSKTEREILVVLLNRVLSNK